VNVALPALQSSLGATVVDVQWVIESYGLFLGALILAGGSIGDLLGRRRVFVTGVVAFAIASVWCGLSTNIHELIAARAVQGVAGATLMPSTLALIRNMFHDDKQRRTAIAIWTAGTMSGIALGPVLSGFLLEHFWWGSVFLINVPFMIMLLTLAPALVPEFRAPQPGRYDMVSSVLSLGAVLPVIYGMQEIAASGAGPVRVGAIVTGVVLAAAFVRRQARSQAPMIDLGLFRSRGFSGAVALSLVAMFAIVGFAIFATQYLQSVRGMSPFTAALWSLVPMSGTMTAVPVSQLLVKRVDRAYIAAGGLLIAAAGYAMLTQARVHSPLWIILLAASIYAGGAVGAMTVGNELIMGAVPPERAGAAAAVVETSSEFGGALGMAVLGSIGIAVYRSGVAAAAPGGLPAAALSAARSTLGGALSEAGLLPAHLAGELQDAARTAFTHGLNTAAIGAAVTMVVAALLCARFFRGVQVRPEVSEPGPAGSTESESSAQPELVR
jgi:MFS transporter, DHA2 family, multidrug resistance protein